HPMMGLL
ncbi:hypothetical protein D043_2107B, partial [Vibrio parahaemolyticus EKP-021]